MKLWKILCAVPLCAAIALLGCDVEDALDGDDDTGTSEETDTGATEETDTGSSEEADTGGEELPQVYKYVRICSVNETGAGSENTYGPDIDAVEIAQGEATFWAASAPNDMQNVTVVEASTYKDPAYATGEADTTDVEEATFTAIGLEPGYITLFFDTDIAYDAEIRVYEVGQEVLNDDATKNDDVMVQVSLDGENWLNLNDGIAKGKETADRVETEAGLGYIPFDSIVDDGAYKQVCSTVDAE